MTPRIQPGLRRGEARFRLSGPTAFARVFKEGRRREGRYVQIVFAAVPESDVGRVGMVVSRKALSRAVDRNRFKRKVRETLRSLRAALIDCDIVVRVKRALPREAIDAAAAEAAGMLKQLAQKKTAGGS